MSSAYGKEVAAQTQREPQLEPYGGKAPASLPYSKPVTYRCRVYRYRCQGLDHDEFVYTMVHDTLENQMTQKLPPGEELFRVSGPSPESIREQMKSHQELDRIEITNWRTRGSL
jgi:hypothetical protein